MVLEKTHRLILHNDSENSYLYVMACLVKVCGHDSVRAEQCALITHNVGKCQIKSGDFLNMFELKSELQDLSLKVELEDYVSDLY
jgi:ATP-dependent Clp protease adaptor protein ClpS